MLSSVSRRRFVVGVAACCTSHAFAQGKPHRIDVHHHIVAPAWLDALRNAKLDTPPIDNWTPERSIEDMDKAGVAIAVTSPTTPQVGFLRSDDAARVTRASNEYARQLAADHPGRFGVFAMLPMPHIDSSLKELDYALETLKADGIGMLTSCGNRWLGHPDFAPLLEELNRRKATVYTHPTGAPCCVNLVQGIPETVVEYGADTTRTIASLIFSGTSRRYADVQFIFSHGGGVLTSVAERFEIQMVTMLLYKGHTTREVVDGQLRRFYYDAAQIANGVTISALTQLVPASQIVMGSDYPYRSAAEYPAGLARAFQGEDLLAVERGNALRLLPSLGRG